MKKIEQENLPLQILTAAKTCNITTLNNLYDTNSKNFKNIDLTPILHTVLDQIEQLPFFDEQSDEAQTVLFLLSKGQKQALDIINENTLSYKNKLIQKIENFLLQTIEIKKLLANGLNPQDKKEKIILEIGKILASIKNKETPFDDEKIALYQLLTFLCQSDITNLLHNLLSKAIREAVKEHQYCLLVSLYRKVGKKLFGACFAEEECNIIKKELPRINFSSLEILLNLQLDYRKPQKELQAAVIYWAMQKNDKETCTLLTEHQIDIASLEYNKQPLYFYKGFYYEDDLSLFYNGFHYEVFFCRNENESSIFFKNLKFNAFFETMYRIRNLFSQIDIINQNADFIATRDEPSNKELTTIKKNIKQLCEKMEYPINTPYKGLAFFVCQKKFPIIKIRLNKNLWQAACCDSNYQKMFFHPSLLDFSISAEKIYSQYLTIHIRFLNNTFESYKEHHQLLANKSEEIKTQNNISIAFFRQLTPLEEQYQLVKNKLTTFEKQLQQLRYYVKISESFIKEDGIHSASSQIQCLIKNTQGEDMSPFFSRPILSEILQKIETIYKELQNKWQELQNLLPTKKSNNEIFKAITNDSI